MSFYNPNVFFSDPKYCGKMKVLAGLLSVFRKQKAKILLFSYSTRVGLISPLVYGLQEAYIIYLLPHNLGVWYIKYFNIHQVLYFYGITFLIIIVDFIPAVAGHPGAVRDDQELGVSASGRQHTRSETGADCERIQPRPQSLHIPYLHKVSLYYKSYDNSISVNWSKLRLGLT